MAGVCVCVYMRVVRVCSVCVCGCVPAVLCVCAHMRVVRVCTCVRVRTCLCRCRKILQRKADGEFRALEEEARPSKLHDLRATYGRPRS